MTADPVPRVSRIEDPESHHGLRPLGPYGEGYCRVCHFVQALTSDGLIERHSRGALLVGPAQCKGSFTKAPKITPFASRKAQFRVEAPDARSASSSSGRRSGKGYRCTLVTPTR